MWKPKSIISGAESSISRTELIIAEVKLTVLKAKAFISGPDLIIDVTNMIIAALKTTVHTAVWNAVKSQADC